MARVLSRSNRESLNNMNRSARKAQLGEAIFSSGLPISVRDEEDVFFVDASVDASGDGKSWGEACKTIQEGINLARRVEGTTVLDGVGETGNTLAAAVTRARQKYVFVRPGRYNEQVLASVYNVHVIGTQEVGNADYGVVVNYDGASATPCAFAFSGTSSSLQNITIVQNEAFPALWAPTCDAMLFRNIHIKGDGVNATNGIQCDDFKRSLIEGCSVEGCITNSIQLGSNGTFVLTSRVVDNLISSGGACGIKVVSGSIAGAYMGSVIKYNDIIGDPTIGIHQDSAAANVLIHTNAIEATTPVTDDGDATINNFTAA